MPFTKRIIEPVQIRRHDICIGKSEEVFEDHDDVTNYFLIFT